MLATVALQAQWRIELEMPATQREQLSELPAPPATAADSAAAVTALGEWLAQVRGGCHWTVSVDALHWGDSLLRADFYLGPCYHFARLRNGNVEREVLGAAGLRAVLFSERERSYPQIEEAKERLLSYAENHGYPFATVYLDSIRVKDERVEAGLYWQKGPRVTFEELEVEGEVRITKGYLAHYLGLQAGRLYDERKLRAVRSRVQELPFLREARDLGVIFSEDKAQPYLFLEKQKASRFDFVLGLLPQPNVQPGDPRSGLLLTGTFDADLFNSFGWGERLTVQFEQLRPGTQELNLRFSYPYVVGLPVGADFQFELYKFDTTFIDIISTVGVQYLFEGGNYLKAFWRNTTSNLLSINEAQVRAARSLPEVLDVRNNTFGLEYNRQELDYRFNPRRGWRVLVNGAAGIKRIRRSSLLTGLEDAEDGFAYASLYDSLVVSSAQYRLQGDVAAFLPLMRRSTFMLNARFGWILSEQPVYFNEQFRIGGNRLLRGFDEESVFATRYALLTLEYRLLLARNSYLFLFYDGAYLEDVTTEKEVYDRPAGFGGGISFETKAGVFGLSLAFGRRLGNPIDWAAPKIHFGYVSLF